jgi:hypothetical protein
LIPTLSPIEHPAYPSIISCANLRNDNPALMPLGELVDSIKAIGSNWTNPSDYAVQATATKPRTTEDSAAKMGMEAKRYSYVNVGFSLVSDS